MDLVPGYGENFLDHHEIPESRRLVRRPHRGEIVGHRGRRPGVLALVTVPLANDLQDLRVHRLVDGMRELNHGPRPHRPAPKIGEAHRGKAVVRRAECHAEQGALAHGGEELHELLVLRLEEVGLLAAERRIHADRDFPQRFKELTLEDVDVMIGGELTAEVLREGGAVLDHHDGRGVRHGGPRQVAGPAEDIERPPEVRSDQPHERDESRGNVPVVWIPGVELTEKFGLAHPRLQVQWLASVHAGIPPFCPSANNGADLLNYAVKTETTVARRALWSQNLPSKNI